MQKGAQRALERFTNPMMVRFAAQLNEQGEQDENT